jgi:hypothetical protein
MLQFFSLVGAVSALRREVAGGHLLSDECVAKSLAKAAMEKVFKQSGKSPIRDRNISRVAAEARARLALPRTARTAKKREDEAKGVHVNEADPILAILQPGSFAQNLYSRDGSLSEDDYAAFDTSLGDEYHSSWTQVISKDGSSGSQDILILYQFGEIKTVFERITTMQNEGELVRFVVDYDGETKSFDAEFKLSDHVFWGCEYQGVPNRRRWYHQGTSFTRYHGAWGYANTGEIVSGSSGCSSGFTGIAGFNTRYDWWGGLYIDCVLQPNTWKSWVYLSQTHRFEPLEMPEGYGSVVFKDGFQYVGCMQDEMEQIADPVGENKFSYSDYANFTNVSITRYADVVNPEHAEKMTIRVCFNFCRTVKGATFFGLLHGRDCYCTPFKKEKPSEGGVCDLPCEGDSAKICGGKHMASIYGMHLCDDTEEDLVSVIDEAKEAFHKLQHAATGAMHAVRSLTSRGTALMYVAAKGGDMESHDLGQAAKGEASTLKKFADPAFYQALELNEEFLRAELLRGQNFASTVVAVMADMSISTLKKLTPLAKKKAIEIEKESAKRKPVVEGQVPTRSLQKYTPARFASCQEEDLKALPKPTITEDEAESARETFVPILELASRWQEGIEWDSANVTNFTQTSCNGDFASNPIIGVSAAECAAVCDTIHPASSDDYCVAIGHYTMSDMDICFLFKDVKAIWEYNCSYSTAEHEEEDSLVQHKEIGQMAKHKAVPHAAVQKSKKLKLTKRNEEPEDEDEPPYDGPQIQNTCLVRHSWGSNTPFKPSVHKLYRCFGMENPDDGVDGSGELGLHEIHSDDAIHFK